MKRWAALITVAFLTGCATAPSNLVPREATISSEKAYVGGVFRYYTAYNLPFLRMKSQGTGADIVFISTTDDGILVYEIEPGEYSVTGVWQSTTWFSRIMETPDQLREPIAVAPGTVTYLGNFLIRAKLGLFGKPKPSPHFKYDYDQFEQALKARYVVPGNIEVRRPGR